MREQQFQKKIIKSLEALGCYTIKVITASRSGVPDIIFCTPAGKFGAIEVKTTTALTEVQKYNIERITAVGGFVRVATPETWDKIYKEILDKKI